MIISVKYLGWKCPLVCDTATIALYPMFDMVAKLEWYQAHSNLTKCIFCRICTSWMLIYVEYMHLIFTLHPRKLHTPYRISYKFYSSPWILETMHDIQFLPQNFRISLRNIYGLQSVNFSSGRQNFPKDWVTLERRRLRWFWYPTHKIGTYLGRGSLLADKIFQGQKKITTK